jgi:hypothetical protein
MDDMKCTGDLYWANTSLFSLFVRSCTQKQTHKKPHRSTNTGSQTRSIKHEFAEGNGRHLEEACPNDIQTAREAALMWSDAYVGIRKLQAGVVGLSKSGFSEVDTVVSDEALMSVGILGKQVNVEK